MAEEVLPGPVDWQDQRAQEHKWGEFREWAEWYLRRWEIPENVVPACWQRHPVIIEELTALWTAYKCSFSSANSGLAPLIWLHQADLARTRMAASMSCYSCGRDGHSGPMLYRASSESVPIAQTLALGLGDHLDGVR